MDVVIIPELIKQVGIVTAFIIIAAVTYFTILKREHKTGSDQIQATTNQQNVVTDQFAKSLEESRALRAESNELRKRIDKLEEEYIVLKDEAGKAATALGDARLGLEKMGAELKTALERAGRLELEVKQLTNKVAVLETEKVARIGELERERLRSETLDIALRTANEQITQLRERVSKLEGERDTLLSMVREVNVKAQDSSQ